MCPLRGNSEESSSHLIPYVEKYLFVYSLISWVHNSSTATTILVFRLPRVLRPFHPHKHQNIEMRMQT
ncbi:hypothetical protein GLYMA_01G006300v4 [Glycine max]|uniref:Uncharacterized protein n=1 Tax=Glycine max TaxID=3847 RepID=A0A0R0LDW2_SOYBN|nr:hypothetical protein GYH30_000064 [Glycine max]KRH74212.1 hypothetical protein GLYMA_01G006300v4 [Glycine max]